MNFHINFKTRVAVLCMAIGSASVPALAQGGKGNRSACDNLPDYTTLKAALETVVNASGNAGLSNEMWATIVNREGVVCQIVFSGDDVGDQWPGSRAISAQKANTANAFGLDNLALSTANLYPLVQPGASLFGLQESNPVDTDVAYKGNTKHYGQSNDPMIGQKIGGVNVFGGGLGLYDDSGIIGAVGVSGDTSCADHFIAWKVRNALGLDNVPTCDNIVFPAHPHCGNDAAEDAALAGLPLPSACP